MACGQLPLGGCGNPDLAHPGPCTPWFGEKPSKRFKALPTEEQARLIAERDSMEDRVVMETY